MKKQTLILVAIPVLVISFAVAFYAIGWNEPGSAPPGGNIDLPVNTGITAQTKTGNLAVNALGINADTGNALVIAEGGNLCFGTNGTDCRSSWPEETPESACVSVQNLYFGGMYASPGGSVNHLTGAKSCPPGYYTKKVSVGSYSYEYYVCYGIPGEVEELITLGGFNSGNYWEGWPRRDNAISGVQACSAGFTWHILWGSQSPHEYLAAYCYSNDLSNKFIEFGGMYDGGGVSSNPLTGGDNCPPGYSVVARDFLMGFNYCHAPVGSLNYDALDSMSLPKYCN